jgi:hypothetical protein
VRIRPGARQSGAWALISTGASAHTIAARPRRRHKTKGKGARTSSRSASMTVGGDVWRVGPYRHPGSRGRQTWSKAVDRGLADGMERARDELHRAVTGG